MSTETNTQRTSANDTWHQDPNQVQTDTANSLFIPPTKTTPENENQGDTTEQNTGAPKDKSEKRYFDLKAHHDKTVTELRNEIKTLKEKTEAAGGVTTMPKTEAELTSFKQKSPELFDMIVALARREAEEKDKGIQEKLKDVEAREQKQKASEAADLVKKAHPDFDQLKADDDFHDWAAEQSEEIQTWIYNNPYNARNAIAAITLYKATKGVKQETSKENLRSQPSADAASLVSTRTQEAGGTTEKFWSPEEIKKMSLGEYEKNKDAIFKQLQSMKGGK
jgi:hypothetical protein